MKSKGESQMLTNKDLWLISEGNYFNEIRKTENFIEVQSRNTGHCWIIQTVRMTGEMPVRLHHKHQREDRYYHLQQKVQCVRSALRQIKKHDEYVLKTNQRRRREHERKTY